MSTKEQARTGDSYADFLNGHCHQDNGDLATLIKLAAAYMDAAQVEVVYNAFLIAYDAHSGQFRMSGEEYIYHPLSVAVILAELKMDMYTVAAAVLHDVIEDSAYGKADLARLFGDTIADLVDGVSKLEKINFESREEAAAASFRKMMLAMASDIRVILIKLADRLHNMRTLNVMRPEKRRRIAKETLEVYAPIALRLGINKVRVELEELGFAAMYPIRHQILQKHVIKTRKKRRELMTIVEIKLKAQLEALGIHAEIQSREKHLYSIYRKMERKNIGIKDVWDLFALRAVVDDIDLCYRVLGVAHQTFKPLPNRFKDYIAIPKKNGYQSLHTILFGPNSIPVEVQIRTVEMNRFAEIGIAAHWIYKTDDDHFIGARSRLENWLQDVLYLQQNTANSIEFLENVKEGLFPADTYVFTPKGRILELPKNATPVDFAYALHTDIGNHCVGARVNRKSVDLSCKLLSGQTVEILTDPLSPPNPAWLNFVVSPRARSGIRQYMKLLKEDDSERLGKRLIANALHAYDMEVSDVPESTWQAVVEEYGYADKYELCREVGFGNRMPALVARRIAPTEGTEEGDFFPPTLSRLDIKGTEGLSVSYAKCCFPIPGDKIVAVISTGRGLVVHRSSCPNLPPVGKRDYARIEVNWDTDNSTQFPVRVRIDTRNCRGVMAEIATIIADMGCDIEDVDFEERDNERSLITFIITVTGRKMLANVIKRLRASRSVLKVRRRR